LKADQRIDHFSTAAIVTARKFRIVENLADLVSRWLHKHFIDSGS
jgi:hypothetical protein